MKAKLQHLVGAFLRTSGLELLPVRVRHGYATGARWTFFPWSAYWRGGYEPQVKEALEALGDLTGSSCWDLGAHFGYYSVGLARRVGPTGQVAAFEPFPSSFARLDLHRKMNRLDQLRVFPLAASDRTCTQTFCTNTSSGDTTVHLPYDDEVLTASSPTIAVQTVRLDELVARGEIRPPRFIKVDVEGHGHRALRGAQETLRRHRPVIFMGFHSPQEVDGTRELLADLGYQWQRLRSPSTDPWIGCDALLTPPAQPAAS